MVSGQGFGLSREQLEEYQKNGYLVVRDLLPDREVDEFISYEAGQSREWRNHLDNHKRDEHWRSVAAHPNIAGVAEQILQNKLMIVQTMLLEKHPGEEAKGTALHQDTHYLPNEPSTLMACWLAMSDTDATNGGLCVVPGTHNKALYSTHKATSLKDHQVWEVEHLMRDRSGKEWKQSFYSFEIDDLDPNSIIRLDVPKGAGVFFSGMTIHGSYANLSKEKVRRAFATHYVAEGTWLLRADVQDIVPAR